MDIDKNTKELKEAEQRRRSYPLCCCWPTSDHGLRSWGLLLIVVGGVWLLSSLGIASTVVWPLFLVGLGVYYLGQSRGDR